MESRNLIKDIQKKSKYLSKRLQALYELPIVGDIRQRGFMIGVEIVKDRQTKETFTLQENVVSKSSIQHGKMA